jgi:hypothetical protein
MECIKKYAEELANIIPLEDRDISSSVLLRLDFLFYLVLLWIKNMMIIEVFFFIFFLDKKVVYSYPLFFIAPQL